MTAVLGHFDNPVPVYLLTGFLGSGKTTLLNRMLQAEGPRTAVIVNEFGDAPIDNDLFKVDGSARSCASARRYSLCWQEAAVTSRRATLQDAGAKWSTRSDRLLAGRLAASTCARGRLAERPRYLVCYRCRRDGDHWQKIRGGGRPSVRLRAC